MDNIAMQTRDIMTAYLRASGNLTGSYERLGEELGRSISRDDIEKIAGSLRNVGNEDIRAQSQRYANEVGQNASADVIGNFINDLLHKGGEIDWEKLITVFMTVGTIVQGGSLMDGEILSLIGTVALMVANTMAEYIEEQGGWVAIVDYIQNMDTTTKVVAGATALGVVAGLGYLVYKAFSGQGDGNNTRNTNNTRSTTNTRSTNNSRYSNNTHRR